MSRDIVGVWAAELSFTGRFNLNLLLEMEPGPIPQKEHPCTARLRVRPSLPMAGVLEG